MKRILATLLLLCNAAWATDWYVDSANEGGTENGTSEGTAWGTIAEGLSGASSGDTIYIKASSTYTGEDLATGDKSLTLVGYTSTTSDGGYVTIDASGNSSGYGIQWNASTSGRTLTLRNLIITGASSHGVYCSMTGYVTISLRNCIVRDNGGNGLYSNSSTYSTTYAHRCVFSGNAGAGAYSRLFLGTSDSIAIDNGTDGFGSTYNSSHSRSVSISNGGDGFESTNEAGASVFVNCVADSNTGNGFYNNNASGGLVAQCISVRNGGYGYRFNGSMRGLVTSSLVGTGGQANSSGTVYGSLSINSVAEITVDLFKKSYSAGVYDAWDEIDYRLASAGAAYDHESYPVGPTGTLMDAYTGAGLIAEIEGAVYITAPGDLNPTALDEDTASQVAYVLLVDSSDNTTPETGVSSPTITISKAGGSFASPSDGTWTEIGNGLYTIGLDATDTSTAGVLITKVVATGCADDYELLQVGSSTAPSASTVAAAVWDSGQQSTIRTRLTGSDTAVSTLTEDSNIGIDLDDTTGTLDAAEIGGDAITAAKIAADAIGASEIATDAIGAAEVAAGALVAGTEITGLSDDTDIADAVLDELMAGHTTAGTLGKYIADILEDTGTTLDDLLDTEIAAILEDTGTTLPATLATIEADTNELQSDDYPTTLATIAGYIDTEVAAILADTAELQSDDYPALIAALDSLIDAIKAKTDNLPTDPADDSDIDAALAVIDGNVDSVLEDTGTTIPAAIADLPTDADVNAAADQALTDYDPPTQTELAAVQTHGDSTWATATGFSTFNPATTGVNVDSIDTGAITADAIAADAIGASELAADAVSEIDAAWNAALAELTTDPGATPTPRQVLALIYMANRNRVDTTSDTLTYYNDAGEAVFTIGLSDDGTTFTRAEMADAE